jgi:hypothetical protein
MFALVTLLSPTSPSQSLCGLTGQWKIPSGPRSGRQAVRKWSVVDDGSDRFSSYLRKKSRKLGSVNTFLSKVKHHVVRQFTVHPEIIVENLKQWKGVPRIRWLLSQNTLHVARKHRPKHLRVFHE